MTETPLRVERTRAYAQGCIDGVHNFDPWD
jgi:hypothetical protein